MGEQPRIRRNIDSLSPEELADYQHALAKLYEISDRDPGSIDGYTYFELLHDGSEGPCEHANDTFLPWHRAHLFLFEEALRRSDPPRTSNVTLPYWDWSALPSGKRYPTAFEDEGSILYNPTRNEQPISREPGDGGQHLPFPRSFLESTALGVAQWSDPLGDDPVSNFGGAAGGESDCRSVFGPGFGALEQPAHNDMHGAYISGDMSDPSAAALDPIFWSFHAYIDLLWWQWQQRPGHEVDTDLEARLCGLYSDREHHPDNRFKVEDVLNTATQLGYNYQYTPGPPPPPHPLADGEAPFVIHPAVDFAVSGRKAPELVRSLDVTIPRQEFRSARLIVTGLKVLSAFSYGVDVYLTPADVAFQPQDSEFRERYFADLLFVWRHHQHERAGHAHHGDHGGQAEPHQPHALDVAVDVGRAVGSLTKTHPGQAWRLWVALAAVTGEVDGGDRSRLGVSADHTRDILAKGMEPDDLTLRVE